MAVGVQERFANKDTEMKCALDNAAAQLRVAMPGIIESFDPVTQTATIQPAITENVQVGDKDKTASRFPLLTDVPVYFPRAGGYCITLPIKKGDECLLVFADMCIDGWWQSGDVQDQMETRRHDLSDAVAIIGITSQPRKVENYSPDNLQLRTDSGGVVVVIEVNQSGVIITAPLVTINGNLTVTGTTITGNSINLNTHTHPYYWTDPGGNANTSPPNGG